jgi:hypothetical protein
MTINGKYDNLKKMYDELHKVNKNKQKDKKELLKITGNKINKSVNQDYINYKNKYNNQKQQILNKYQNNNTNITYNIDTQKL